MERSKQLSFDKKYLRMAQVWSENSKAVRRKVGCLVVKGNMIISDGYNGTPSGFPNVCEDVYDSECKILPFYDTKERVSLAEELGLTIKTKPEVLHAEANAITKLAKSNNSSSGATLYVTCEPCLECSKMIIQAGIKRVVYSDKYRIHDGIELLKRAGIEVEYIDMKED